ncbi:MAG: hypothetical protein ACP5XB_27090, partial [Isosphaeraceae bacterium]
RTADPTVSDRPENRSRAVYSRLAHGSSIVGSAVRTKYPGDRSAQRTLRGAIGPKTALSDSAIANLHRSLPHVEFQSEDEITPVLIEIVEGWPEIAEGCHSLMSRAAWEGIRAGGQWWFQCASWAHR